MNPTLAPEAPATPTAAVAGGRRRRILMIVSRYGTLIGLAGMIVPHYRNRFFAGLAEAFEAEARARSQGFTVLAGSIDKPHGLRECVILDDDGYAWVPAVALPR